MRYSKKVQDEICNAIRKGDSVQHCSELYGIPTTVIISWCGLGTSKERAKEISIRKYITEITDTESRITDLMGKFIDESISDDDFFKLCDSVMKQLTDFSSEIVRKERNLNYRTDDESDASKILNITNKWCGNQLIKDKFSRIAPSFFI